MNFESGHISHTPSPISNLEHRSNDILVSRSESDW